jgi:transcriptional regulator with XRE-family HTH domain
MEIVARQLVRALRGARSQQAFSRRLGYRSNPVAEWEAGRRFPTAAEILRACRVVGVNVEAAFAAFPPGTSPTDLPRWLDGLRGDRPLASVARDLGRSRFAVARWLSGEAEPRLPDFLALVDLLTGRLPDLLALLVPIEEVPALLQRRRVLEASRRLAWEQPWSQAVVAALDTAGYRALPAHRDGAIAERFGFDVATERACLADLEAARVIARDGERWVLRRPLVVDTAGDAGALRRGRQFWLEVARGRAEAPSPEDVFAVNVFSVAEADLERIRERFAAFYREVRQIVAASEPTDTVALLSAQVIGWSG